VDILTCRKKDNLVPVENKPVMDGMWLRYFKAIFVAGCLPFGFRQTSLAATNPAWLH
jgi:hypothetical protein